MPLFPIYDCMNVLETPPSVLVETTAETRVVLGPNRELVADDGWVVPTALAERALLALRSIHRAQDPDFEHQSFRFHPRRLVDDFMYPERKSRASGREIKSILEQIERLAHTRLRTDCWWDTRLGRNVRMNASLIDYVQTVFSGNNNAPQEIEVGWGKKAWESLRSKHTRQLDSKVYVAIERPFDLRLYRWLDRQLSEKSIQRISAQKLARSKLALQGKTIERGGRTASSYIAKKLEASVNRLNGKGFPVKLTIDRGPPNYMLTFKRLKAGPNQLEDIDPVRDLLRHFAEVVHGTQKSKRRIFHASDRALAHAWLEQYGTIASQWMTAEAARRFTANSGSKPRAFRALEQYEDAAQGAWERRQIEIAGQQCLPIDSESPEQGLPSWMDYYSFMSEKYFDRAQDERLHKEVEASVIGDIGHFWRGMAEASRRRVLESSVKDAKIARYNLLSEQAYRGFKNLESLNQELVHRHGVTVELLRREASCKARSDTTKKGTSAPPQ